MKMKHIEAPGSGGAAAAFLFIPDQERVDDGEIPSISVYISDKSWDAPVGIFTADLLSIFMDGVDDEEDAEIVAEWLELFAEKVREKFTDQDSLNLDQDD